MSVETDQAVDEALTDPPTEPGYQRDVLDRFYTDARVARACIDTLACPAPARVLEPHAGGGSFVRAVLHRWPEAQVTGVDIDPDAPSRTLCTAPHLFLEGDFLRMQRSVMRDGWDLVVGNPPYRDAADHVEHALKMAPRVGFLLRLGFLASRRRRAFFRAHPVTQVLVLRPRPSFTLDGKTDGTEYGWFTWDDERTSHGMFLGGFLDWRE